MKLIEKGLIFWMSVVKKAIKLSVQQVNSGQRHIISSENYSQRLDKVVYGRSELDSHTGTAVTGAN